MVLDLHESRFNYKPSFLKDISWRSFITRDNIITLLSALVSIIGLWIIGQRIWGETSSISSPISIGIGLFFLGIALKSILESRSYDALPRWIWPVRYISLLIPATSGIYFLSINLMRSQFDFLDRWITKYPEIAPVVSIL